MAKKKTYVVSRARLAKKLDKLVSKLAELDPINTAPTDINDELGQLESELSDLVVDIECQAI